MTSILPSLRSSISRSTFASSSQLTLTFSRSMSSSSKCLASRAPSFSRPGPPQLPPSEQKEFEALQAAAQTVGATPTITQSSSEIKNQINQIDLEEHRDLRKGPRKDFEGDINPMTGERGGPKVDPFKAGDGDWSFAGRVTGPEHWNFTQWSCRFPTCFESTFTPPVGLPI